MKNRFRIFVILLSISAVLIYSCSSDDTTSPTQTKDVKGYVKSANGTVPVQGVLVSMTSTSDNPDTTRSDANGYYQFLNVPSGNKKLVFSKGSFGDTINITVPLAGNVQDAKLKPVKPLAFYWGEYDNIQTILRSMGYTGSSLDSLTLADFSNLTYLQQHSIIFINCGSSARYQLVNTPIPDNLRAFLNDGGKIYASDWAFGCVNAIHPELNGTYDGNAVDSLPASVVYSPLQTYLGKSSVRINYNLGSWLSLDPGNNYTVNAPFLRATYQSVTNNPIAFFRSDYTENGKLIYTTFHNEAQVTGDMIKILQFFIFEL